MFIAADGLQLLREHLVMDRDLQLAPEPLLGSSQRFVSLKQAMPGCSVLRALCKVVPGQALAQELNLH